jgi:O-antigen/teichoic acid export membrane protein
MRKSTVLKNAFANIARGMAAAFVAVVVPPFLTRSLSTDVFGAWALILQLGAYVGYLDFGLQTAVGRFYAHSGERQDFDQRDRIVSTATFALVCACLFAVAVLAVVSGGMGWLFHGIPASLLGDARPALLLVGVSLAIGLPFSVINGIFIGQQRYEIPAALVGGSKLLSAILVVGIAHLGGSLIAMASVSAAVNIGSYAAAYIVFCRNDSSIRLRIDLVDKAAGRELFNYCYSLTIWSFSMLFVTGLDLTVVGIFDFGAVPYYAVAASLTTFISGLQNAVFTTLIPSTAVLHARGESSALSRLLLTSTRYGSFILLLCGLPLIFWAKPLLSLWVGPSYATAAAPLVIVLVVANMIRLSATPYSVLLIGTGQQRLVTLSPFAEGATNVVASIVGCYFFGAIGVAVGTLVGTLVGVGMNVFYNMRRTTEIQVSRREYANAAAIRPLVCVLPLFGRYVPGLRSIRSEWPLLGISIVLCCLLTWRFGLEASERSWIQTLIPKRAAL